MGVEPTTFSLEGYGICRLHLISLFEEYIYNIEDCKRFLDLRQIARVPYTCIRPLIVAGIYAL
jgi:hypothetical protein